MLVGRRPHQPDITGVRRVSAGPEINPVISCGCYRRHPGALETYKTPAKMPQVKIDVKVILHIGSGRECWAGYKRRRYSHHTTGGIVG